MAKIKKNIKKGNDEIQMLYEHRNALYIALCKSLSDRLIYVWRTKKHSDKTTYKGWFVLGINESNGLQITYHLPISKWKETNFAKTLPCAPKWDNHTSEDVLKRLKNL